MKPIGSDSISLRELSLLVRIGCSKEERSFPQRLLANVHVACDTTRAAASSNLDDTVCYLKLRDRLQQMADENEWLLQEELAHDMCAMIFEEFPLALEVRIELEKFAFSDARSAGLRITRAR